MSSRLLLTALICVSLLRAGEADLLEGVVWSDGLNRGGTDTAIGSVVVIYFCGHCPRAGAYMNGTAKAIDAEIEKQQKSIRLYCITPDLSGDVLVEWAKTHGYVGAAVGYDPRNRMKVSLNNIFQGRMRLPDGRTDYLKMSNEDVALVSRLAANPQVGVFRYPVDDLTMPASKELWWACERDRPQAIRSLVAAEVQVAKKKDEILKAEVAKVAASVRGVFEPERDRLISAPSDMAAYESLESLVVRYDGFDLKSVIARLKDMNKDKAMKKELTARDVWRKCVKLKASSKPSDQLSAEQGLALLAKQYADTVYGKRAGGG